MKKIVICCILPLDLQCMVIERLEGYTEGTPVWIIYSGCIRKQFSPGSVLRWLRSFIATFFRLLFHPPPAPHPLHHDSTYIYTRVYINTYRHAQTRIYTVYMQPFMRICIHIRFLLFATSNLLIFIPPPSVSYLKGPRVRGANLHAAGATRTNATGAHREGNPWCIFVFARAHSRVNVHPSSRELSVVLR